MTRSFKQYTKRTVHSLSGMWRFITDPEDVGIAQKWFQTIPDATVSQTVPSCWNNEFGLYEYDGVAWYFKEFCCDSRNISLEFGAVTGYCEVYLDGELLGSHYGGFSAFQFFVGNNQPGSHLLAVRVDSRSDEDTIPLKRVDWYHYGGIIRDVTLYELPQVYIENMLVDYTLDDLLQNATVRVRFTVHNLSDGVVEIPIAISIGKKTVCFVTNIEGITELEYDNIILENISLWDVFQPNLYTVKADIGCDDCTDRIGFRRIECNNQKILLNKKEIYIKGINRHEDHPDWGFAFPSKLMKKDIDIIKDMGCNAIRGSHYPNSKLFLDMLDEEGILFWSEIPMWGFPETALENPVICDRAKEMHREMLEQYYNHPSIVIWGLHNEIDTRCEAGYTLTKQLAEQVRAIDKSRLITYATMYFEDDICLQFADFISINKYLGWYSQGGLEEWEDFLAAIPEKLKKEECTDKPVVMSEFGAAAIYGHHTFECTKGSEEYQKKLFRYTLQKFHNQPYMAGTYLWQFCDVRTCRNMGLDRARGFNNKGILNEYRRPKMSYETVKELQTKW